jgi:hypothetical protein
MRDGKWHVDHRSAPRAMIRASASDSLATKGDFSNPT